VQPATGLLVCPKHNLKYAPSQSDGCVLCRRAAEPPPRQVYVPSAVVVLALGALVGGGAYYALAPTPRPTQAVPSAAMLWGTGTRYAQCGSGCGQAHLACDDQCSTRADSGDCQQYCFEEADKCFSDCDGSYQKMTFPWSYHYGTETMPEWSEILVSSESLGPRLIECSQEPVSALAFVRVPAREEEQPLVTVCSSRASITGGAGQERGRAAQARCGASQARGRRPQEP